MTGMYLVFRPKFLHVHAEWAESRKMLDLIHAFELKLQHFEVYSHMFVCGSHAFAMFPPTRYVSVRYLENALYPISKYRICY